MNMSRYRFATCFCINRSFSRMWVRICTVVVFFLFSFMNSSVLSSILSFNVWFSIFNCSKSIICSPCFVLFCFYVIIEEAFRMIILLRMHTKIMLIEGNKTHLKNHKIHICMYTHVLYKLCKNCSYMHVYTCIKMY